MNRIFLLLSLITLCSTFHSNLLQIDNDDIVLQDVKVVLNCGDSLPFVNQNGTFKPENPKPKSNVIVNIDGQTFPAISIDHLAIDIF